MFSLFRRGPEAPQDLRFLDYDQPLRPDQARMAAWARALDNARSSTDPPPRRRPHRGMLPDVDWSNAEPMPPRRPLLRLIAGLVANRMLPMAAMGELASRTILAPRDAERKREPVAQGAPRERAAAFAVRNASQPRTRAA